MRLGTNLGNSLTVRGIGGHRRKSAMSKLRYSDHKQYEATDQKWPHQIRWPGRPTVFGFASQVINRDFEEKKVENVLFISNVP